MRPEQENFESLQRLLKLKRYEQPPPRYFDDFSRQVIARIQAGEQGGGEGALGGWLQRIWGMLEARPALPAAFGAAVCGLLVFGAVYSEQGEKMPPGFQSQFTHLSPAPGVVETPVAVKPQEATVGALLTSSTNPVIQLGGTLFDQIRPVDAARVGFKFGN